MIQKCIKVKVSSNHTLGKATELTGWQYEILRS